MKSRKQIRLKSALIAILCIGLAVLGYFIFLSKKSPTPKFTGPVEYLTAGTVGEYSSLVFIAQEKGYFRDNGLEVTTREYSSGPPAIVDLLAGKVDIATAAEFVGVRNSFHGEDLKILASTAKTEAFYLAVRADHQISKAADLKGRRIGVTSQTAGEFYFGQFLILNNLSRKDLTIVDLPPQRMVELITDGELDAIVTFDPHVYKLRSSQNPSINVWSLHEDHLLSPIQWGTGKLVNERPEAVKRYLQALVEAEKFVKNHDLEARDIVKQRLNYDDEYMSYIWPKFHFEISIEQTLMINMDDAARWVIDNKLTTATKIPNYLRLVYFDGLDKAKPEGITIIR